MTQESFHSASVKYLSNEKQTDSKFDFFKKQCSLKKLVTTQVLLVLIFEVLCFKNRICVCSVANLRIAPASAHNKIR